MTGYMNTSINKYTAGPDGEDGHVLTELVIGPSDNWWEHSFQDFVPIFSEKCRCASHTPCWRPSPMLIFTKGDILSESMANSEGSIKLPSQNLPIKKANFGRAEGSHGKGLILALWEKWQRGRRCKQKRLLMIEPIEDPHQLGFGSCVWATHTYNKRVNPTLTRGLVLL